MSWLTPKTDWNKDNSINYDDFNRIETNIEEIVSYLASYDYQLPAMTFVLNRTNKSIDYLSSINRIENNLETIKSNFITPVGWQDKKTWTIGLGFSFKDANRLESNIQKLRDLELLLVKNFRYCGTFNCGQDSGVFYV